MSMPGIEARPPTRPHGIAIALAERRERFRGQRMYTTDGIAHTQNDFDASTRALRPGTLHGSTAMRKTTMQRLAASMLTGLSMLVLAPSASAQYWGRGSQPNSGACFYEDINYGGRYFCTR